MPAYKTARSGASHLPTFSSTVEVEGEEFYGKAGKSKKQAELNAAKVACIALKERKLVSILPLLIWFMIFAEGSFFCISFNLSMSNKLEQILYVLLLHMKFCLSKFLLGHDRQ